MRKINSVLKNYTSKGSFEMKNVRILAIDDIQMDLSIERDIKYLFGTDVDVYASIDGLMDIIAKEQYDIILMDYSLKNKDFEEYAKKIRRMGERYPRLKMYFENVPIIILIGKNALGGTKIVLGDGVDDFIPKPSPLYYTDRMLKKWIPANKRTSRKEELSEQSGEDDEQDIYTESKYYANMIVDGLDMEKCMNYCGYNKAKYVNYLQHIYKKGITGIEAIENYIKRGDMANFIEQARKLKLFAKDIGAVSLYEIAKTTEIAGYSGDYSYVIDRVGNLLEMYYSLISNISTVLDNMKESYKKINPDERLPISHAECQNELFLILKYMDDIRPQAAVKAIDRMLCCSIEEQSFKKLQMARACIDDMEYEKAIFHLSELLKKYTGGAL